MIDVLICDDHIVVLAGLERLVATFAGMRVVATATDGAGAVVAVRQHRPHVVLMDLQMPGMDGIDATRLITRDEPQTRVVILTPHEDVSLSPRELETLALVAKGMANKQIGRKLQISEATVKAHLTSIFRALGAENRTQAARWYERHHGDRP